MTSAELLRAPTTHAALITPEIAHSFSPPAPLDDIGRGEFLVDESNNVNAWRARCPMPLQRRRRAAASINFKCRLFKIAFFRLPNGFAARDRRPRGAAAQSSCNAHGAKYAAFAMFHPKCRKGSGRGYVRRSHWDCTPDIMLPCQRATFCIYFLRPPLSCCEGSFWQLT